MKREFDKWSILKKQIDGAFVNKQVRSGEIWICRIGKNIGFEIDGKGDEFSRPVLIIKSYGTTGAIILPLTSTNKESVFQYVLKEWGTVKLTQIRFLDSRRFTRMIGIITKKELIKLRIELFKII